MARAEISDPEVLRRLRKAILRFDADIRRALGGISSDTSRVKEWLGREQLLHWKAQLRKREEVALHARLAYIRAAHAHSTIMKSSGFDERKAHERAKRAVEEAEGKLAAIKRWTRLLDEKSRPLLVACTQLGNLLERNTPRTLQRIDTMLDSLEEYFRAGESG